MGHGQLAHVINKPLNEELTYRKIPKISDTRKFAVITLKVE